MSDRCPHGEKYKVDCARCVGDVLTETQHDLIQMVKSRDEWKSLAKGWRDDIVPGYRELVKNQKEQIAELEAQIVELSTGR